MTNHAGDTSWELIGTEFEKLGLHESAFMARQIGRFRSAESSPPDYVSVFWSVVELENRLRRLESAAGIEDVTPRSIASGPEIEALNERLQALESDVDSTNPSG